MYIISVDLGSSNYKAIIMKIVGDDISLVGKKRVGVCDFNIFFEELIKEFNIDKKNIEIIVVTGTGASYIGDNYDNIKILKIDEFDAIGYGGLILAKKENGLVVSIGTGTAFIESDLVMNKHLGGTGLGGGTFVGLGKRLIRNDIGFSELISQVKNGDRKNVDLLIGDISSGDIGNLTKDITAANFAGITKTANQDDIVAGIANMIIETVALMAKQHNRKKLPIIFIGTFVTDEYIKKRFMELSSFMDGDYVFVDNADYAIAIGAYEYYLLRHRDPRKI